MRIQENGNGYTYYGILFNQVVKTNGLYWIEHGKSSPIFQNNTLILQISPFGKRTFIYPSKKWEYEGVIDDLDAESIGIGSSMWEKKGKILFNTIQTLLRIPGNENFDEYQTMRAVLKQPTEITRDEYRKEVLKPYVEAVCEIPPWGNGNIEVGQKMLKEYLQRINTLDENTSESCIGKQVPGNRENQKNPGLN